MAQNARKLRVADAGMSEQPPTNDEQPEPPTPLSTNAESVIQQDLARIRKRKRASSIAGRVLLVLFLDLCMVRMMDYGVSNRTLLSQFPPRGTYPSYTPHCTVFIYETPEGKRVMWEDAAGYTDDRRTLVEDPPPHWTPVAWVAWSPVRFQGYGYGLLTPWSRETDYRLGATTAAKDKDLPVEQWRGIVCDWLVSGASGHGERAARVGRALRKGDHVERSFSLLCFLHDIAFVCAAVWSVWTLITGAVLGTSRAAMRIHQGHCPVCSYNLLSDFSRGCPECGWGRTPHV
ncbi:MAG: hypothetical protein KF838_04285 [Phycisphaeraceae bacterium]|nr:MAG: hypothetical protein KF838_04285 [Phycisphaeraceae bacterium]